MKGIPNGKLTEAGEKLAEKMFIAYRENFPGHDCIAAMEAVLRVAAEEILKGDDCILDRRRNTLFAPLELEERVAIADKDPFYTVLMDGKPTGCAFLSERNAEAFRIGVIQQIKEGKR